ncbi:MAG: class I SAM-dependent methyltransferase [Gemmatimonadaceae bacterium]
MRRDDDLRDAIDHAWRELDAIDHALARDDITEDDWYRARQALIVPAYLAADDPRAQSGYGGDDGEWEAARGLLVDAIDRDGTFADIGCANGHLMESVCTWSARRGHAIEPYGVDLSPELARLAAARLPHWRERIWVGNGLDWLPLFRFDFVHLQDVTYVPVTRREELVAHLLEVVCRPGGRLIIGPFNESIDERAAEKRVVSWGYRIAGRAERPHRHPDVMRPAFWVDA